MQVFPVKNSVKWVLPAMVILLVGAAVRAETAPAGASAPQAAGEVSAANSPATAPVVSASPDNDRNSKAAAIRKRPSSSSNFTRWKRRLPFWPRKGFLLLELSLFIALGVLLAQVLEVSGVVGYLAIIAWPLTKLGKLNKETGPAFLMAFQSGAIANSMLVSSRSDGSIDPRQLYTSVFVVSCLSLFAHLPTYVLPIGAVLGTRATAAIFSVRLVAIAAEIFLVLTVSRFIVQPWLRRRAQTGGSQVTPAQLAAADESRRKAEARLTRRAGFWATVWNRSRRTMARLILYLVPSYALMATLEFTGFFRWLTATVPGLFGFSFLPAESTAIIPAQALSLYSGAVAAANFVDSGSITVEQAVITILVGSMVTAPVRTLKHALPTYLAVLGPRAGLVMAVSAQVLRVTFLAACTAGLWIIWNG